MGVVDDTQESTRFKVARAVLGLSLIVLSFVLPFVLTQHPLSDWWLFGSMVLITVGVELSVGPEMRAWNQRNKARIAERDTRGRPGFDSPDQ